MKAVCPNNENHKEFVTVVHVIDEWVVDEEGNWIETKGDESQTEDEGLVHGPDAGNTWTCHTCGAEAEVTD